MDIQIRYNNGQGQMIVHCDNFFPTSQAKFKKLLKIIDMDYDNRDDILKTLEEYFQSKISSNAKHKEKYKKNLEFLTQRK